MPLPPIPQNPPPNMTNPDGGGRVDLGRALSLITVVFNDGDRDIPLPGRVVVYSNMDFKKFKETICQKIGVEPHQIATFLIRRRKGRSSPDRKAPIDESTDFDALVSNTQDCHILAVLRKSPRRDRRPRRGIPLPRMPDSSPQLEPWEKQILDQIRKLEIEEHELKLQEQELHMRMQMEQQYMMANYSYPPVPVTRPRYAEAVGEARQRYAAVVGDALPVRPAAGQVCRECQEAWDAGRRPEFHPCIHDPVVENLRPMAGSIQRPR